MFNASECCCEYSETGVVSSSNSEKQKTSIVAIQTDVTLTGFPLRSQG